MPVTPSELDLLREDVQTWYTDTCDQSRLTKVQDAYGGEDVSVETEIRADVPCFVETTPGRAQLEPLLAAIREEHIYILYLPPTIDVLVGDHFIITSRDNLHLRVEAVMSPETLDIELVVAASSLGEHHV